MRGVTPLCFINSLQLADFGKNLDFFLTYEQFYDDKNDPMALLSLRKSRGRVLTTVGFQPRFRTAQRAAYTARVS